LAKKKKKTIPERALTKHQLSKWQRQMKIRRIVIIAAVVFLVGISSWVGYEAYKDYKSNPLHEVVIEVNGVPFTMEYYVNMLNADVDMAIAGGMNSTLISYYANYVANNVADSIINAELQRQGAKNLGIEVTTEEIEAGLNKYGLPDNEAYRDMVSAALLQEKLKEYFGSNLTDTMEQAHLQVMLVESQEVADEVITEVEAGGNFTALAEEFSCNSSVEGDLGWLPEELMPNTLIANAAFNLTIGEISQPIYDETAIKDTGTPGGYWLVEIVDRGDHELEETVKTNLIDKRFNDWFAKWKGESTIANRLDENKISWAVNKVLENR
jgi:parvulin-like peptidyl-prolyl isomerase